MRADSIGRCNGSPYLEVVVAKAGRPGALGAVRGRFWDGIRSGLGVAGRCGGGGGGPRLRGGEWFREAGGVTANGAGRRGGGGTCRWRSGRRSRWAWRRGWGRGRSRRRLGRAGVDGEPGDRPEQRAARGYRAVAAQARAEERARRPEAGEAGGERASCGRGYRPSWRRNWSPEQVSARLRREFPDDPEMRVSPETIYQSLYVQGRGALRRELAAHLRTGRALRRPRRRPATSGAAGSRAW